MTNDSNVSRFTVYCKNDALKTLGEIIQKYKNIYSSHEAAYQLGLKTRMSAATSLKNWRNNGIIPLKHLIVMCNETGYDIKSFTKSSDVLIKGRRSHKEIPYEDVLEFL